MVIQRPARCNKAKRNTRSWSYGVSTQERYTKIEKKLIKTILHRIHRGAKNGSNKS